MNRLLKTKLIIAGVVAIVTFAVYLPALRNGFVNWDDAIYVYENPFIRSLDLHLLKSAFTGFYAANWHPLTWLSHGVDYALWGLNTVGHHLTNNIFHALNAFLVVLLVAGLLESSEINRSSGPSPSTARGKGEEKDVARFRIEGPRFTFIAAGVTGLLFGLHPLHVESVAWVAERKDVLSTFFYLLAMLSYVGHVKEIGARGSVNSASRFFRGKYLCAIGFFVLSLLSKPMAVTLPFVLLILDWYLFGRMRSWKSFWAVSIEKLPFLVLALVSAVLTVLAHEAGGAIMSMKAIPLESRLIVAVKSLVVYLLKMMLPIHLVPYYPYPENISLFSWEYIIPVVAVMAITAACVTAMRRQGLWISVWGYYVVTLVPVLGVVQVGGQSMADRYTYLPSLGPFLLVGLLVAKIYQKAVLKRQLAVIVCVAVTAVAMLGLMAYASAKQIGVWKNSILLWNYVIYEEPEKIPLAYNNLGAAYASEGQLDLAVEQYRTALMLRPYYTDAHYNLGEVYMYKGQLDMAIEQYQTTLRLRPDYAKAHFNLGVIYLGEGSMDLARREFEVVLKINPHDYWARQMLNSTFSR